MNIGLQIADLEMSFTNSFKNTASTVYGVTFSNSDVNQTLTNLQSLYDNVVNGNQTGKHSGYSITADDVLSIIDRLQGVLSYYKEQIGVTHIL